MKTLLILSLSLFMLAPCLSQESQIKTERKYNENSNHVHHDSVYTYSYNSNDFEPEEWDSVFYQDETDNYHRYNFDHYFNRPVTGLPYRFQFDFNEDFYKNFTWPDGMEPNWEYIDSLFERNVKSFQENMEDLFDYFYEEGNTTPQKQEYQEGIEL